MTMLRCGKVMFSIILLTALLSSCNKEDVTDLGGNEQTENLGGGHTQEGDQRGGDSESEYEIDECFDFVYPITLVLPDLSEVSVTDNTSLEVEIDRWYDANPDVEDDPTLIFPVDVVLEDGSQQRLNSIENLDDLIESCEDDDLHCEEFDEACFDLQYPVSFALPDGSQHTVNDEQGAEDIIEAYYDLNPDEEGEPTLIFPVTIIFEDGASQEVLSESEFEAAEEQCEEEDEFEEDCFQLQFPLSFILSDGSTHTALDELAAETILEAYYAANPDEEDEDFELVYPVTIILEDGSTQDIGSEEALETAEELCED